MAVPKLNEQEWAKVRSHWELDPREGFTWVVKELGLPVSPNGVKKKAVQAKWKKAGELHEPSAKPATAKGAKGTLVARTKSEPRSEPSEPAANLVEDEAKPFKTRETPLLDELDRDEPKQGLFVREYVKCLNASLAARRAGYTENSPDVAGARLLASDRVQSCVRELRDELLRGLEIEARDVLEMLMLQLKADINEISQFRRVCCRACYGTKEANGTHARQLTPLEYQDAKLRHDEKRAKYLSKTEDAVDIGEFPSYELDWYDKRREPNPDCPECFGEGLGEVYFGDTRKLSKAAKALYGGVKTGKDGIEIIVANREKVIDQLCRVLGLYKERDITINVTAMNLDLLQADFERMEQLSNERQAKVDAERGNIVDAESVTVIDGE